MAPMRLMRALAPRMAEARRWADRQRLLVVGQAAVARLDASYSVTKAAELSLSRVFADAWAGEGVLVNAIAPGPIGGRAWRAKAGSPTSSRPAPARRASRCWRPPPPGPPLGRMGTPEEVAATIVFLCSEQASNVAGAAWSVDGGSVPTIV